MSGRNTFLAIICIALLACAEGPETPDVDDVTQPIPTSEGGSDDETGTVWEEECTDGIHCEGSETADYQDEVGTAPSTTNADDAPAPGEGTADPCEADADADAPACTDADGDGFMANVDCNDSDSAIRPWAAEVYCDGVDQNCNHVDECDTDGDSFLDDLDCDPNDATVGLGCYEDGTYTPEP